MNLVVLCGIPGSGKTTYAKKTESLYGCVRHSYDDLPNARTYNYEESKQVMKQYVKNIKKDLKQGKDVICDNTFLTRKNRLDFLKHFKNIKCRKSIIAIETSLHECHMRNSLREGAEKVPVAQINFCAHFYERPQFDEGWDDILCL